MPFNNIINPLNTFTTMPFNNIKNPLNTFTASRSLGHPIPLKDTSYEVEINSGLAMVKLQRTFKNDEAHPIEATITFPVPFNAAVYDIETKINDRVLLGKAEAKAMARAVYEDAIDRGKPAVLHEELLKGLHMLSVANVAPEAVVVVTATFAVPMVLNNDGDGELRIPVTVGQIYGQLPLQDSDALITNGRVTSGVVTVMAQSGKVFINGDNQSDKLTVELNRPIDIQVVGLFKDTPSSITGRSSSGKSVSMSFSPLKHDKSDLDIVMLLDVSGSMNERITSNPEGIKTKWEAVRAGVNLACKKVLTNNDKVSFATFASGYEKHGTTSGNKAGALLDTILFTSGGTRLPEAIDRVTQDFTEANVLLVTDGKSGGAIDVQKAIASGARFTVVLIGEDALEVNVGYLAALTGGQMFIVQGCDAHRAVNAAIQSMRNVGLAIKAQNEIPTQVERNISGVKIEAQWKKATKATPAREGMGKAVAAYAASLSIHALSDELASELAADEGLVTHLTSIVLVDEAAESVDGIPATRKVSLPIAATNIHSSSAVMGFMSSMRSDSQLSMSNSAFRSISLSASGATQSLAGDVMSGSGQNFESIQYGDFKIGKYEKTDGLNFAIQHQEKLPSHSDRLMLSLRTLAMAIDWDNSPANLLKGDFSNLSSSIMKMIEAAATINAVLKLGAEMKIDAKLLVVALIADTVSSRNRSASRIARTILSGAEVQLIKDAKKALGL